MGSEIGSILIGVLLSLLFAVIIFEGATDVNNQYNVTINDETYASALDDATVKDQESMIFEISNTAPGGSDVSTDLSGGEDVEKSLKKTLSTIFTTPTLVKKVIIGDKNTTGMATKIGVDPRIASALYVAFFITIALIVIRAFIKNAI